MSVPCYSCCSICLFGGPSGPSLTDAYADLDRSLPAGTINWALLSDHWKCEHKHARDGWHPYPGYSSLESLLKPEDVEIARSLEFLVLHHFAAATCCIDRLTHTLILRVYLIPHDLPNVQGRLRQRDETTVLAPGRRALQIVLPKIMQDDNQWSGLSLDPNAPGPQPFLPEESDNRTLAEIYSDLPSPPATIEFETIPYLRTSLHPYQRRSVAMMLDHELDSSSTPDPLYVPIVGIDGQIFYFQPGTMEILRDCPRVAQVPGGILCEELGTGKTIMTLALILSTLDQLPCPEESIWDTRPVLTPLSLHHFSFSETNSIRKRLGRNHKRVSDNPQSDVNGRDSKHVPTLIELVLHYCRVNPGSIKFRSPEIQGDLEARSLWDPLMSNTPFCYHFPVMEGSPRSPRRQIKAVPKKMYLSGATLVVVPSSLVRQWETEIGKHCDEALRVLVVRSKTQLPSVSTLASLYDIILMSYNRFANEGRNIKNTDALFPPVCQCPDHQRARVPDCRCETTTSPLSHIRWKRLVIDEGHVAGTSTTDMMTFAESLSVERRWIVTGTPTTNLLGLHFGQGSEPVHEQQPEITVDEQQSTLDAETPFVRRWGKQDREDLKKFSVMLTKFLKLPQFSAESRLFTSHLVNPLTAKSGPRPGAIQALTQVMSSVMVRHRIEDVERDVLLPSLAHDTVYLDLDHYGLKTYNVMQANIAINAVDSERIDQDYLFHRRNASKLLQLIDNLSQALFWHCDEDCFHVDDTLRDGEKFMQHALERNTSAQDMNLLHESIAMVTNTARDVVWRRLQCRPFVFHRVHNMQQPVYEAWTALGSDLAQSSEGLLPSDRLGKFRDFLLAHPLAPEDNIADAGYDVSREDARLDNWRKAQHRSSKSARDKEDISSGSLKELEKLKSGPAGSTQKLREMQEALHIEQERQRLLAEADEDVDLDAPASADAHPTPQGMPTPGQPSILLSRQPSARIRIGNSTSSKLDYILKEVLRYSATEKFLIFSKSPLTLAFAAEGLELIRVKYLTYMSTKPAEHRDHAVLTFETSPTYRVFLMELKHGARGLNLVTASRVIFCEPVWQADVETQAIKRVHRIGQKRPVTVKTLAIRGTYEEVVVSRREALKARSSNQKQPNMTDDRTIRDFIANPTFLKETSDNSVLDIPLFDLPEPPTYDRDPSTSRVANIPEVPTPPGDTYPIITKPACEREEPPWKKMRMVRFADVAS
ncbi:hypothetical protein OBBRIDRAFT_475629 [Obba rivulosa]|uniref:Uncharacterized protein n=1 Tax=Obba rivulosa TaxID=1052685 RepID=A0A8E2DMF4_9APHY|nr:hypothetical protein OBBRIDRAFT_475629 [Obba rivulosa]